jgi:hypothetical protein
MHLTEIFLDCELRWIYRYPTMVWIRARLDSLQDAIEFGAHLGPPGIKGNINVSIMLFSTFCIFVKISMRRKVYPHFRHVQLFQKMSLKGGRGVVADVKVDAWLCSFIIIEDLCNVWIEQMPRDLIKFIVLDWVCEPAWQKVDYVGIQIGQKIPVNTWILLEVLIATIALKSGEQSSPLVLMGIDTKMWDCFLPHGLALGNWV